MNELSEPHNKPWPRSLLLLFPFDNTKPITNAPKKPIIQAIGLLDSPDIIIQTALNTTVRMGYRSFLDILLRSENNVSDQLIDQYKRRDNEGDTGYLV